MRGARQRRKTRQFRSACFVVLALFNIMCLEIYKTAHAGINFNLGSSPVRSDDPYEWDKKERQPKEYPEINGVVLRARKGHPIESLVTPEKVKTADIDEKEYFISYLLPITKVLKSLEKNHPDEILYPRYDNVMALLYATGWTQQPRGPREAPGFNRRSKDAQRSFSRRMVREGKDIEKHLKKIRKINREFILRGIKTKILVGEQANMPIPGWRSIRVLLQGIQMNRKEGDFRLGEIAKPLKLIQLFIRGYLTYDEFYEPFLIWIEFLKDRDPDYKERFETIEDMTRELDAGRRSSSPVEEREYPIINGRELRARPWHGIETLTTPEEVAAADELDRRYLAVWIMDKVWEAKYKKDPRYEALNALYNATGFRRKPGLEASSYNKDSMFVRRARLRRDVRERFGDIEEKNRKISQINGRLIALGIETEILEGETSSPIGVVMYGGSYPLEKK